LLAIETKPRIIKIQYGVLDDSNGEPFLVLIYEKYLDSNIKNAIGIKATLFAYEIAILITVRSSQDLIFSIDRNWGITCTGSTKTDWS
jgi:hypothetical protein